MLSYPWRTNSCWLDSTLESIYAIVSKSYSDFMKCCQELPPTTPFYLLSTHFQKRHCMLLENTLSTKWLQETRDDLRDQLIASNVLQVPRDMPGHTDCSTMENWPMVRVSFNQHD
jgi:hypothetical protein